MKAKLIIENINFNRPKSEEEFRDILFFELQKDVSLVVYSAFDDYTYIFYGPWYSDNAREGIRKEQYHSMYRFLVNIGGSYEETYYASIDDVDNATEDQPIKVYKHKHG